VYDGLVKLIFNATIGIIGVNPYVAVSANQAEQLKPGARGPIPVLVKVNGEPDPAWRINMMPMSGGGYFLYLSGVVRQASGTKVGDQVEVSVEFDKEYRGGPEALPEWFESALESHREAMAGYSALSPSRQKEIVRYLVNLKSDEAKKRNLAKALKMLGGEPGHYMGRDWEDGK
jgi:hypothetical protein